MRQLSKEEIERYSRHIVMPEIGIAGQQKLAGASVLLVGAGGLGSAQAVYLAAAGVGRIGLVDDDQVSRSNLQRQVIYREKDVGRQKVAAARERLLDLNPFIEIELYNTLLKSDNALDICRSYDIIMDGTDNFGARYLINDVCVLQQKPNIYGSVFRFDGQISIFGIPGGPCYRCLFPFPPAPGEIESCAVGGVFGALPGVIGSMQVIEAVKLITGNGRSLAGRLLLIDGLSQRIEEIQVVRDPHCPVCGDRPVITEPVNYEDFCGLSEDFMAVECADRSGLSPESLKRMMESDEQVKLIDLREPAETKICRIDGAVNYPVSSLERLLSDADAEAKMVVFCRSGVRSARIVKLLNDRGYKNVRHLNGGILAWIDQVDATQPKY